jgi:hypothetical protein
MKIRRFLPAILLGLSACAAAFYGLDWDLPSAARTGRMLAPAWDKTVLFDRLASGWQDIYAKSAGSTPLQAEAAGRYSTHLEGWFLAEPGNGLPPQDLYNSYRSMLIRSRYADESLPLSDLARMKPAALDLRPPSFLYGGGYIYSLGAYFAALTLPGVLERLPLRQALEKPQALARIYLAGRAVSAAALIGICLLAALITAKLSPSCPQAAAFAAVLSLPSVVIYSHYLTPHLWAAFWGLLSLYFALSAVPGLRLRPLIGSAVSLAMAAGSYWSALHAAALVFPVLFSGGRSDLDRAALKRLLAACLAGAAVFLAVNPYLLPNWSAAVFEVFPGGSSPWAGTASGTAGFLLRTVPAVAGPAMLLLVPAGCVWALLRGTPAMRSLSIGLLILLVPVAMAVPHGFAAGIRRFFPWLVSGAVLGIIFLWQALEKLPAFWRGAMLAAALAPGLLMSGAYLAAFSDASGAGSTYRRMADTLDSMPAGAELGMTDFPQPAYMPAFRLDRWKLKFADERTLAAAGAKDLPRYLLVNFESKPGLSGLIAEHYDLFAGFYPRAARWFTPDPALCAANPPLELYRLRKGGGD